jgi:endonuclease YncB( thermonuclease family)
MKLYQLIPKRIYDYELRNAKKGEKFTYQGHNCKAKVVDIYDGDTLTLIFRYGGKLQQHSCRMLGYDSPEMKPPKNQSNRDKEIIAANKAKDALSRMLSNRLIDVHCGQFDKYGRILITIWINPPGCCKQPINVNQWMIENGYGIPYEGGTKVPYQEQITYPKI